MLYSGTDPGSYITEYALVYEEKLQRKVLLKTVHPYPHGGLQPFHQKSTYPDAINFKALFGTNLVT